MNETVYVGSIACLCNDWLAMSTKVPQKCASFIDSCNWTFLSIFNIQYWRDLRRYFNSILSPVLVMTWLFLWPPIHPSSLLWAIGQPWIISLLIIFFFCFHLLRSVHRHHCLHPPPKRNLIPSGGFFFTLFIFVCFFSPKDNVLPSMATSCAAHPKASEPGAVVQPLHVYGILPAQLPAGEKTLHHLCVGLPRCPLPHLLQLLGQLLSVPLSRCHTARCGPRPGHSWNLRMKSVTAMWTVDWIFLSFFFNADEWCMTRNGFCQAVRVDWWQQVLGEDTLDALSS